MTLHIFIICLIFIIFIYTKSFVYLQFLSYFDNFVFNVDMLIFTDITEDKLILTNKNIWLNYDSQVVNLSNNTNFFLMFEIALWFFITLVCLITLKYVYKWTWKTTLKQSWLFCKIFNQFFWAHLSILIIYCHIYNIDLDWFPTRLRADLDTGRVAINFFQHMINWPLTFVIFWVIIVIGLRYFVWGNARAEEFLRPITIFCLLNAILTKVFMLIFLCFLILMIPHTSFDLRLQSWYSSGLHNLIDKNTLPYLYNDEYWNFTTERRPLLLPEFFILTASVMNGWVWLLLFFDILKLFKQWQNYYILNLNLKNNLSSNVPNEHLLDKRMKREEGDWFNSQKMNETFVLQIIFVFIRLIFCINLDLFMLLITENLGVLAITTTSYWV